MASFSAFALSPLMVSSLKKLGYREPSTVQKAVIPKILRGDSLLAQSETGSGKTHAFLVPIIDRIDVNLPRVQSIVIAPTRELARQIYDFATELSKYFQKLKVRLFTSESDVTDNLEGLRVAPHIAIGTPGRLHDILIKNDSLNLRNVKTIVLDEADMLLDMGYFEHIEGIFASLETPPQTIVLSATLKQNLRDELRKFVSADFEFESDKTETSSTVAHHFVDVKHQDRAESVYRFLTLRRPYLALVFASKKTTVEEVSSYLQSKGMDIVTFTGSLDDRDRKKALRAIKKNDRSVIVASDLLSRGIDIQDVSDVISVDLPSDLEFYYHRAGRTGRFGKSGDSWVFYDDDTTKLPLALIDQGKVNFDFYTFRGGNLKEDPVGLLPKRKLSKKKDFVSDAEKKEIKIAKANTRTDKVKPAYKKKRAYAIDRVKHKYKRKAIQKAVRRQLQEQSRYEGKGAMKKDS